MNRETLKKCEKRHKGYKGGHCNDVTDHESRTRNLLRTAEQISGDHRAVAPPVPIPNTAVKRCSPDGSATKGRARVGRSQNKNPARFIPVGVFNFWHAYSSREHAVLGSRWVDGQAREGSG